MAAPGTVFLDEEQRIYLSCKWMNKIPVSPPNLPLAERLLTQAPPGSQSSDPVLIIGWHSQTYVSLRSLNFLLTTSVPPLLARVFFEENEDGVQEINVLLSDMEGKVIAIDDCDVAAHASQENPQQAGIEGDHAEQAQLPYLSGGTGNDRYSGAETTHSPEDHNVSQTSANSAEYDQLQAVQVPDGGDDQRSTGVCASIAKQIASDAGHNNNNHTATAQNTNQQVASQRENSLQKPIIQSGTWALRRAALRELKDLKPLTGDNDTLSHLLDDRFPPTLANFSRAGDAYVHLATLQNGTVYWIKILSSPSTHPHEFICPKLDDRALLHRPISRYQRAELTRILKEVERTERGKPYKNWTDSLEPAECVEYQQQTPNIMDLRTLQQKLKGCATMENFINYLDLIKDNAQDFHGSAHEKAAAAQLVVQDIHRSMRQTFAVENSVLQNFSSSFGLIREIVIESTKKLRYTGPKYVLPLGSLHWAADSTSDKKEGRHAVLMDVLSPHKAIWRFLRLHNTCVLTMLAHDLDLWKLEMTNGGHEGGLSTKNSTRDAVQHRQRLTQDYNDTSIEMDDALVYFKRAHRSKVVKELAAMAAATGTINELPEERQGQATLLQKSLLYALTQHVKTHADNAAYRRSNESRAMHFAMDIERAVYQNAGHEYLAQCRTLADKLSSSLDLIARLLDQTLTPLMLVRMFSDQVETEAMQPGIAATQQRSQQQSSSDSDTRPIKRQRRTPAGRAMTTATATDSHGSEMGTPTQNRNRVWEL